VAVWESRAAIEPVAVKFDSGELAVDVGEAPGLEDSTVDPPEQPATAVATRKPATATHAIR
jgi:hypothetical protein